MSANNYWEECLACSFDEHGISVTDEQLKAIARDVEGAHENHGMGGPDTPHPAIAELKNAHDALQVELSKVFCEKCGGQGVIITQGPYHSSRSQCWKCGGQGRHSR